MGDLLGKTSFKWWQLEWASYKYTVEEISQVSNEFNGVGLIQFAYLNGLKIEK